MNHHTTTCFFEDVEIPVENLIGEEGKGFRYIIDGWNAERILVASEAIGDGPLVYRARVKIRHATASCLESRSARTREFSFRSQKRTPMSKQPT